MNSFDVIFDRLTTELGPPALQGRKLIHWEVTPEHLAVILLKAGRGTVVLPWNPEQDAEPYFSSHIDPPRARREGRSTNIAPRSKSVGWDRWIIYLDAWNTFDLDMIIFIIACKKAGKPVPAIDPPHFEPPSLDGLPVPSTTLKRLVFRRDKGRCTLCGSTEELQYDHDLPESEGGAWSLGNVRLLCRACNLRKSNRV